MKVFFALLLIVNIAFAVFQWLMPYDQLFVEKKKVPTGEQLQLLTEADMAIVSQSEVVSEVVAQNEAEPEPEFKVQEEASDLRICYTIGPIKDRARALEISGRYTGNDAWVALKSSLEKQYLGVMVYIGGHPSRGAAITTANKLSAQGIRDHIIVDHPEQENILSLGVFGLKKNADRLKDQVVRLGFPVQSEARYREHTIYWLYIEQSSKTGLLQLLLDDEFDSGISQIPTACLPA